MDPDVSKITSQTGSIRRRDLHAEVRSRCTAEPSPLARAISAGRGEEAQAVH